VDEALAECIREEIASIRARDGIPTELRLDGDRWRRLAGAMVFGDRAGRRVPLFEGVKCVLTVGMSAPAGYRLRSVQPPDD
jgi:hypothetical protein